MDAKLTECVTKNIYGFYQLKEQYRKPMKEFYEDEYYQEDHALYSKNEYGEIDVEYRDNLFAQKVAILGRIGMILSAGGGGRSMLDIGCGEGYALSYFSREGWDVCGVDLSSYGLRTHNPDMERFLRKGDFEKVLGEFASERMTFDYIDADHVLEHLPDPEKLVNAIDNLMTQQTVVSIAVPNDFSIMQQAAFESHQIDEAFWVTEQTSEHFSYFSEQSLCSLFEAHGYEKVFSIADWPIDFFLLNKSSNYRNDASLGHDCHLACLTLENKIFSESMDKAIELHRAIAEVGIGREITVFFRRASR